MSAIASASVATILAFGVAVAMDVQRGPDHVVRQVTPHGLPGPAQVELADQTASATNDRAVPALDRCRPRPADPDPSLLTPAIRALRSWPAMLDTLRPVGDPGGEQSIAPATDSLVELSIGPAGHCETWAGRPDGGLSAP